MGGLLDSDKRGFAAGVVPVTIVAILGSLIGVTLLTAGVDIRCHYDASLLMKPYPGATLESQSFTFMRPYGVGVTQQTFFTEDDVADVRRFYTELSREADQAYGRGMGSAFPDLSRRYVLPSERAGTVIRLTAVCARPLDLSPMGIGRGRTT